MTQPKTAGFSSGVFDVDIDTGIQGSVDYHDAGTIFLNSALSPQKFLIIAIHEALHAENPHWSEETVDIASKNVGRFLWRLGYRRKI
jgi:hypothetical protein